MGLYPKVFPISIVQVPGLQICTLGAHEVGELEGDGFVVAAALGGFQFEAELVELDGEEADGHIPVEAFRVGPALHAVTVCKLFVHGEEGVQLVVVYVAVLEGAGVNIFVDAVEDLVPLPFVLLYADGLFAGDIAAGGVNGLFAIDPRRNEGGESAGHFLALAAHGAEALNCALGGTGNLT